MQIRLELVKFPRLTEIGPKDAGGIYCQTLVQYTIRASILRVQWTSYTDDWSCCLRGRRGACLSQQFWYVTSITDRLMSVVMTLCSVIVDLSPLKPFKTITTSRNSYYYYVNYELGVTFGPELTFSLIHEGRVLKSVVAKYA